MKHTLPALLVALSPTLLPAQQTDAATRMQAWELHQQMARESPFAQLQWRAAGPILQGGRIEAIAVPPGDGDTIYLAPGSGNLWKTTNNGLTWRPIFEHQSTFTIGDVAIASSDPDIVWVGTGETQPRHSGYSFAGTGVFKSTDAGETWQNMGLHDTHHIGKVVIDPVDPDVVYVGAIGHFWSPNRERGVFKTTDGGETWEHVLRISPRTGVVDLAMDPADPRVLYASAWQMMSGRESGIYKSTDAGESWQKLGGGLPTGPMGRSGLDVSVSNPNVVYAFVDNWAPSSEERREIVGGQVYRSDDKGRTWRLANRDDLYSVYTVYGWKFCDVRVAPDNEDEIYILGNRGFHSTDGGATYTQFGETILRLHDTELGVLHLDHHELWIDPENTDRLLLGNDGGFFISHDKARTWLHVNNLPIGEFYTVSTDMADPYNIYGGTQDNASLYGPNDHVLEDGGEEVWRHVFLDRWHGGDGFVTLRDPTAENTVYYEHQHGDMRRMDITGSVLSGGDASQSIRPRQRRSDRRGGRRGGRRGRAEPTGPRWQFGWYTPFIISQHDPHTLYAGGNMLFKSPNRGDDWSAVSPVLADPGTGERGVVPFGTITMIAESPFRQGLLYVGTEGGSIHLTRDDGATWEQVDAGLPEKWVSRVVASRHETDTVYVSFTGYRQDDFEAYVYVSRDHGRTWTSIRGNLPSESINVIAEDPMDSDILYVGTDLGVYASVDRGQSWHSLSQTLPTTPVHDLTVHPREGDLIIATHGRSVFVLDATPIRAR